MSSSCLLIGVFTTVLSGVSVFVLGQIVLKWMIDPIQELRTVISDVRFFMMHDHTIIHTSHVFDKSEVRVVDQNLTRLGAGLLAKQQLIPFYCRIYWVVRLPKPEDLELASKEFSRMSLIMWESISRSEKLYGEELDRRRKNICKALRFKDPIRPA